MLDVPPRYAPDPDPILAALHLQFGDSGLGDHLNQLANLV
jgi:hypothetical protein